MAFKVTYTGPELQILLDQISKGVILEQSDINELRRPATKNELGRVIVGEGLDVDGEGEISLIIPPASSIKIDDYDENLKSENIEGALAELYSMIMSLNLKSDSNNIRLMLGDKVLSNVTIDKEMFAMEYDVSYVVRDCEKITNRTVAAVRYEPFETSFTPCSDHTIDKILVEMGGLDISNLVVFGNEVKIPKVLGNVMINVIAKEDNEWSVTNKTTHCKNNNSSISIIKGGEYTATITPDNGFEMKEIIVKMGGVDISENVTNNSIHIPIVTGPIVIEAKATKKQVFYKLVSNITNCTLDNEFNSILENTTYKTTIKPSDGYSISDVVVTMGGDTITSEVLKDGNKIEINKVTGNITINAVAVKNKVMYNIDNRLEGCSTTSDVLIVEEYESYSTTLKPVINYEIQSIIVTMNGIDITDTVVNGNNIEIPNVTGNVIISAIAAEKVIIYYSIYTNLINCKISNPSTKVKENGIYATVIEAKEGFTLTSVEVTMNGEIIELGDPINEIRIENVIGDIEITAIAD